MNATPRSFAAMLTACIALAQQPEFEVASVKRSTSTFIGSTWRGGPGTPDPGNFTAEHTTIAALAFHAYGTKFGHEIECKSPWMSTELYDIAAKVPPGTTREQFALMVQQLLSRRFALVVHRESRQLPGYRLVVSEKGAKLTKSLQAPPESSQPSVVVKKGVPQFSDSGTGTLLTLTGARIRGRHEDIQGLIRRLIQQLSAPVIDATGLEGEYDYDLSFIPEALAASVNGPTLHAALQEQLGLKLEPVKSIPVEVVVLDKANKEPTAN